MERRVLAGAVATLLVVVGGAAASSAVEGNFVGVVLLAGLAGGAVAGVLSAPGADGGDRGHVGAGARAGGYGGAAGFAVFVLASGVLAAADGDPSWLFYGFQRLLVALLVVPLHALSGAVAAAVGVRVRRAIDRPRAP